MSLANGVHGVFKIAEVKRLAAESELFEQQRDEAREEAAELRRELSELQEKTSSIEARNG